MSLDGSSGMAFEGDGLGHHERRFSPRKTCFTSGVIFKRDTALRLNCVLRDMSATGARMELRTPDGDLYETCTRLPAYFTLALRVDHIEVDCAVVWRKGAVLGVRFLSPRRLIGSDLV